MTVARATTGGDYFSPWIGGLTGGQVYCATMAVKWAGTGATPFIAVQTATASGAAAMAWIVGGGGYVDSFGPVQAVDPNNPDWQQFHRTLTLSGDTTLVRFVVELFGGMMLPGENGASFDGFSLTSGECVTPSPTPVVPYSEEFESGAGGWADGSGTAPVLASDGTSPAGPGVMTVARATTGGDYTSPWIGLTGGPVYCAAMAVKWAGTGATPFIGVQTATATEARAVVWIGGGGGYVDSFGPVQAVDPNNPDWQQLQTTLTLSEDTSLARFVVELYGGMMLPGENGASFDGFSLTSGACP
jgi:hypothetical protein